MKQIVVIVLGGYAATRIPYAVDMIKGTNNHILISGANHDIAVSTDIIKKYEIPQNCYFITPESNSTYSEAVINYQYLKSKQIQAAQVVTNQFHYKRTKAVYAHVGKQFLTIKIDVVACPNPQHVNDRLHYHRLREYIKSLYYLVRYGVWAF